MKRIVLLAFLMLEGMALAATEASTESDGFAPSAAAAETGPALGASGQFVLTMGARTGEHALYNKQGSAWQLQLQPALDYFVTARFSVGGILGYRHATGGAGTPAHVSAVYFQNMTGTKPQIVHYRGAAAIGQAFAGDHARYQHLRVVDHRAPGLQDQ